MVEAPAVPARIALEMTSIHANAETDLIDALERYRDEKVAAERKFWKAPLNQLSMPMTIEQFDALIHRLRATEAWLSQLLGHLDEEFGPDGWGQPWLDMATARDYLKRVRNDT